MQSWPARDTGFLEVVPTPPATAHQFPEPTMHTFRGAAGMAKPECCSTLGASQAGSPACTRSAQSCSSRRPHPVLLSTNGLRHPAPAPEATADSREDPPRHSQEPLRTPGSWPAMLVSPHPCPMFVGMCSSHSCRPVIFKNFTKRILRKTEKKMKNMFGRIHELWKWEGREGDTGLDLICNIILDKQYIFF